MSYRTNIAYSYDGSFEGLLCCVYESYYQKELPAMIFPLTEMQATLFPVKEIISDEAIALRVERSISTSISKEALRLVRLCYLSHMDERERNILLFLRLGYKTGASVTNMLANDIVHLITKTAQNVASEGHFYKEFLRFSEFDGGLVAIIEPKNFVLPLTAPHFCDRFPSEQFLIYDKTHKVAFCYENTAHHFLPLDELNLPEASDEEKQYRALWKTFYNTISIEGRYNPKRRMGNMPKRYWSQLTELMD